MSEPMTDERLERGLRDLLRDRDPGAAPYGLTGRVDRIPDEVAPGSGWRATRVVPWLAGAAAVVALVVAGSRLGSLPVVGTGADPSVAPGPTGPYDPTRVGPGILVAPLPDPALPVAIGILLLVVAAVWLTGWRRLVPLLPAVLLAVWAIVASQVPVNLFASGYGVGLHTTMAEQPPGFEQEVVYETAPSLEPFDLALFLNGTAAVPLTIEGFVDANRDQEVRGFPVWQAAWFDGAGEAGGIVGPDQPFGPFVMPRTGQVIHLVGSAGRCAYGPTFDPATATSEEVAFAVKSTITVQVTTLGWPRTIEIPMGFDLAEPYAALPCNP
jgi:hypothetical protein